MECPNCKKTLIELKFGTDTDGTIWKELECPKCKQKFGDFKIPHSAFL